VTSASTPPAGEDDGHAPGHRGWLPHGGGNRLLLAVLVVLAAGGVALAVTDPFTSDRAAAAGTTTSSDSSLPITQGRLSSQTQVDATLGYQGSFGAVNEATGTYTSLPGIGSVISQGHVLYAVSGNPVVLLYGSVPCYRSVSEGISGADVRQLNADLVALGEATRSQLNPHSNYFSTATATALEKLQRHLGVSQTGSLALGSAVFLPSAARVTGVMATLGAPAPPGQPVLQASSTSRVVTVALDADLQTDVHVGDQVTITLPDNATTHGVVSSIGSVATAKTSGGSATITVLVTPVDPAETGRLDQAPVQVSITTASVSHALIVPVNALLAQGNGQYAVEVVGAGGSRHLVPVTLGLFDDAAGLVQVTGSGISAGQRVVVPSI